jgi:hypothetical protein
MKFKLFHMPFAVPDLLLPAVFVASGQNRTAETLLTSSRLSGLRGAQSKVAFVYQYQLT